ncbi:hypothetical protein [Kitasatospora sp. NPDC004531]
MRRRTMVLGAVLVAGLALGVVAVGSATSTPHDRSSVVGASKTTGLRTDLGPMVTRFHRFGELESAQWVVHWPGSERELVPSQEHPMFAVLHLKPGQVDRLLAGRTTEAAKAPGFAADDMPGGSGLPASLAPYVPTGGSWVVAPELAEVLVSSRGEATVRFDRTSDTVVIDCVNPWDPDEPTPSVGPDGTVTSVTPSPFVLPS